MTQRRRSAAVMLGIMPLLATGLTGCGGEKEQEFDNVAICVDPRTEQRVDDDQCDDDDGRSGGGFGWYYFGGLNSGRTYVAPAVGQRVSGGTYTTPTSGTIARSGKTAGFSVPKSGGAVARGGFGGGGGKSGGGFGGGGGGKGGGGG